MPKKRDHNTAASRPLPVPSAGRPVDPLVTVETQREHNLLSGEWAERTFVKLYVAARQSGLLAAISDRDWKTLCTLATYMDGDGYCFPSQAELAAAMGCSRQMANERVKSLAEFRFRGQQVLLVVKGERTAKGEWAKNGYRVLPISKLRIYDGDQSDEAIGSANDSADGAASTVSSFLDTAADAKPTVSSPTVTVGLDTNKKHPLEPDLDRSNFEGSHDRVDESGQAGRGGRPPRAASPGSGSRPATEATGTVMPLGEILKRRAAAAAAPGTRSPAPAHPVAPADLSPRGRRGGRAGSPEERELVAAYLRDWVAELGDEAPLSSTVTRALGILTAAGLPQERWPDLLYQARALVREHSAQIRKKPANPDRSFAAKNRMPYFLAVLEDLAGLRPEPADRPLGTDHPA